MVKLATGWTCDQCGFAPFSGSPREKVPPPAPLVGTRPRVEIEDRPRGAMAPERWSGPQPVLFPARQPRPGSAHMLWSDAGSGLRFAAEIPLQVLPPGEAVDLRVLVENRGPYITRATLLVLQSGRLPGPNTMKTTVGDLPPGSVFDASYNLEVPLNVQECKVSVFCLPMPPEGNLQDPWKAPELREDNSVNPLRTLPCANASVKFRARAKCPRCESTMTYVRATAERPRAWVCEDCQHRVETGLVG